MCDVSRFGLKEEKEIAVLLSFVVVGEETFLNVTSIFKMTSNFILLSKVSMVLLKWAVMLYLFQCHAILDQQSYSRVQITNIFL
jgi:hypothetical protein